MTLTKPLYAFVLAVFLWSSTAQAGPVNPQHVAQDAKWYLHLDMESLLNTTLGKKLKEAMKEKLPSQDWLENFKKSFGFDPEKDLKGLTLYNTTLEQKQFVALLYCKMDQDFVLKLVALNPDYTKSSYGDHLIHSYKDKGQPMAACFYSGELLLFAESPDRLKSALDVLDGKKPGGSGLITAQAAGTFAQGAVGKLSTLERQPNSQMMADMDAMRMAMGEQDGKFAMSLTATTKTEETATQLKQIMEGIKAMVLMNAGGHPEAAQLLQHLSISAEGKTVGVKFDYNSADLIGELKKMDQRK